jgi:hypothetical protein
MLRFVEKGTPLPAHKRHILHTAFDAKRGQDGDPIRVPVVEGENQRRADRNRLIGTLSIAASRIRRDVPAGSEVEVTIDIDPSRLIRTKAYIPYLDEEFEAVLQFNPEVNPVDKLKTDLAAEKKRLDEVRTKIDNTKTDPLSHRPAWQEVVPARRTQGFPRQLRAVSTRRHLRSWLCRSPRCAHARIRLRSCLPA